MNKTYLVKRTMKGVFKLQNALGTYTFQTLASKNTVDALEEARMLKGKHAWYDVSLDGREGYFMKIEEWISASETGGFVDYDGWGDLLDSNEQFLNKTLSPSRVQEVPLEAKYILWYNK